MANQCTIKEKVSFAGIGLHTGTQARVEVSPLGVDSGIVFERKDIPSAAFKASPDKVLDPVRFPRRTCVGSDTAPIQTIEHLMAALHLLGIDNVKVDIWGEEIPGLDGSAKLFADAFLKVGKLQQDAARKYIVVQRPIVIDDGSSSISAQPLDGLCVGYNLKYDNPVIGERYLEVMVDGDASRAATERIYEARTFCLEEEAKKLLAAGLGKGSNYNNTLVVSQMGVVNNSLRFDDEFARHKVMDLIGDLYLAGPIKAKIVAVKSGHAATIKLLEKIMQEQTSVSEGANKIMYVEDIMKIVPHRFPFLLVDRVIELEKGKRAVGIKNVTMNEHFFQGHFPSRPVMPGVLIIEALAQVACVTMFSCEEHRGKLAFFMAINNAKFRKPVVPGDQLRLEVEVGKVRSKTGMVNARALVDGAVVAEGELMFAFV